MSNIEFSQRYYDSNPEMKKLHRRDVTTSKVWNLKNTITASILAVFMSSTPVDSEQISPCGDLKLWVGWCDDLVLRTYPNHWDFNISNLRKFLSQGNEDAMNANAENETELLIQHAQSEDFITTMAPVFQEIQRYSGYRFQGAKLLDFISLHQFLEMGERDMAEDLAEDIIFMYPEILELRFIFEKYNFISRQA